MSNAMAVHCSISPGDTRYPIPHSFHLLLNSGKTYHNSSATEKHEKKPAEFYLKLGKNYN
jgi:hypothetical protein